MSQRTVKRARKELRRVVRNRDDLVYRKILRLPARKRLLLAAMIAFKLQPKGPFQIQ